MENAFPSPPQLGIQNVAMPAHKNNRNVRLFFTLYKTTNLINGKIYIGVHETENLDDDYIGSGSDFRKDVKKFGRDNFRKEILLLFENADEMIFAEKLIVDKAFINRKDTYNKIPGGKIPPNHKGKTGGTNSLKNKTFEQIHGVVRAKEIKKKLSNANTGKTYEQLYGEEKAKQRKEKARIVAKNRIRTQEEKDKIRKKKMNHIVDSVTRNKISKKLKGRKLKKDSIEKRTETRRKNGWNKRDR